MFNTMPMMGKGQPGWAQAYRRMPQQVPASRLLAQEQRRRINAMLQDYELQRRLHAEQLQFGGAQTQQAAVQVPGYQTLGNAIAVMKQLCVPCRSWQAACSSPSTPRLIHRPGRCLQQMNLQPVPHYELSFVSITKQGAESLRYRHAKLDNRTLAQLLQLDGPCRSGAARETGD